MALSLLCIQVWRIVSHLDFKENTKNVPQRGTLLLHTYGNCSLLVKSDLVEKKNVDAWRCRGINFFYSTVLNKWQIGQYKKT